MSESSNGESLDGTAARIVAVGLLPGLTVDRLTWRGIWAATVLGAVWRIALLSTKWSQGLLFNDSLYYSFQAAQNARGQWFRMVFTNGPGAEHPPLVSLVMTPASLLGNFVFWQRATNTVIGIVLIPLIALLALRVGGRRAAVVAALVAAAYPNLWMNDVLVMSESVSALLVVLVLLLAWRLRQRFELGTAAAAGACIGLAALSRSELLLLAPLIALVGCRSQALLQWAKRAAIVLGVAGAVVGPWMAYNLSRFDAPVLLSTNEGSVLLGSNCDETYGGPVLGGWLSGCLRDTVVLAGEDASELSRRRRDLALRYVRGHLEGVPLVVVGRLLRTADLYGIDDLILLDAGDQRPRWASWSGIVGWWALAPMAALGWWRRRRIAGSFILLVPVISVVVTAALFYGAHRLRSPMEPVVVVCAALGLVGTRFGARLVDRVLDRMLDIVLDIVLARG